MRVRSIGSNLQVPYIPFFSSEFPYRLSQATMAKNLFSVPIFFIVFRETLEAAIIVSVLLGLVEQIVHDDPGRLTAASATRTGRDSDSASKDGSDSSPVEDDIVTRRRLVRKLRIQVFLGAGLGLLIALAIGAAFIAVWFTKASDLWAKSEELWEGNDYSHASSYQV